MRVKPCPKDDPASLLLCDFCGTKQGFLYGPIFEDANCGVAICHRCCDSIHLHLSDLMDANANLRCAKPAVIVAARGVEPVLERNVEESLFRELVAAGYSVERQKRTSVGVADLVVEDTVIEVKPAVLTRREFHQAAGQGLAYAEDLKLPKAIVAADHVAPPLQRANALGVPLLNWRDVLAHLEAAKPPRELA